MHINLRCVNKKHYVCRGAAPFASLNELFPPHDRLPKDAKKFWKTAPLYTCDKAIVATYKGEVVGFFRFFTIHGGIAIAGTWVAKNVRKLGLGTKMWDMALRTKKVHKIQYAVASAAGRGFIESMMRRYPDISFRASRFRVQEAPYKS